jgi:hypothetical protein
MLAALHLGMLPARHRALHRGISYRDVTEQTHPDFLQSSFLIVQGVQIMMLRACL